MKQPSREDLNTSFNSLTVSDTMEGAKLDWITEAVDQSVQESHKRLKEVEGRLMTSMEDRFTKIENMIASSQRELKHEHISERESVVNHSRAPGATPIRGMYASDTRPRDSLSYRDTRPDHKSEYHFGGAQPTALPDPTEKLGATGPTRSSPVCASSIATGQLSDALRQLSLAVDIQPDKAEGMLYRPEWYAQRKLKDTPIKSLDYQKLSLCDLQYGMTCVLEYLLKSNNPAWHSYLQHMKYVSRQASTNSYIDAAFSGYDRMVVDKYLEDPSKGFQAGDVISVSSNFHAANFKRDPVRSTPKRRTRSAKARLDNEEPVEVPESWPSDICYYYNRRSCYGKCNRSHICHKCHGNHRDLDCKTHEKKN